MPEASITALASRRRCPAAAPHVDGERVGLATGVDQQVAPRAPDPDDAGVVLDAAARGGVEELGQRAQVVLAPLATGGVGAVVRRRPGARRIEEAARGRVDELGPRGEEAHVRPLAHGRAGVRAGLEDDDVHAALDGVRGGGQPDGAGADDDDGVLHGCPPARVLIDVRR